MIKVFLIFLFLFAVNVASANSTVWTCVQGGKTALTISTDLYSEYVVGLPNPQIAKYLGVSYLFTAFSMYAPNDSLLVIPGEYATGILFSHDNGGMRLSSAWIDREHSRYVTGNFWYFNPGECVRR